jgi:hypothetical protein
MEGVVVEQNFERRVPKDHPSQILLSDFRRNDLNVIFYQNIPNLHNLYKSECIVNYSSSYKFSSF